MKKRINYQTINWNIPEELYSYIEILKNTQVNTQIEQLLLDMIIEELEQILWKQRK